jgi:hypothetical protein
MTCEYKRPRGPCPHEAVVRAGERNLCERHAAKLGVTRIEVKWWTCALCDSDNAPARGHCGICGWRRGAQPVNPK